MTRDTGVNTSIVGPKSHFLLAVRTIYVTSMIPRKSYFPLKYFNCLIKYSVFLLTDMEAASQTGNGHGPVTLVQMVLIILGSLTILLLIIILMVVCRILRRTQFKQVNCYNNCLDLYITNIKIYNIM